MKNALYFYFKVKITCITIDIFLQLQMISKIIGTFVVSTGLISAQNFTTISQMTTSVSTITSCLSQNCVSSTEVSSLPTVTVTEQSTVTAFSTFCPSQASCETIMSSFAPSSMHPFSSSSNASISSAFEGGAMTQGLPAALAIIGAAVLL